MGNEDKFDSNFPLAHRTDLPEHERRISAKSLQMLEEGQQDIREGRIVRYVELVDDRKCGPSLIQKLLRACRLHNVITRYFSGKK